MTSSGITHLNRHLINSGSLVLDMDGTILDLGFDDFLWNEALPAKFAANFACSLEEAQQTLRSRLNAARGTLAWYCFDHWTKEIGIDVAALERAHRERIRFLPGAAYFLAYARRLGSRLILATNAHPQSLALKSAQTGLHRYVDLMRSSHLYLAPKESPAFWSAFLNETRIDPASACFIDDNPTVLKAAETAGFALVLGIEYPVFGGRRVNHTDRLTVKNLGEVCAPGPTITGARGVGQSGRSNG